MREYEQREWRIEILYDLYCNIDLEPAISMIGSLNQGLAYRD